MIYLGMKLYKQLSLLLNSSLITLLIDRVSDQKMTAHHHFSSSTRNQRCAFCQVALGHDA